MKAQEINDERKVPEELANNYIYISHLDEAPSKFWYLPLYPDEVNDSMASTFQDSTALGRTAPIWTYSNSGPRKVTVSLKFHRELFNDANDGRVRAGWFPVDNLKEEEYSNDDTDYCDSLIRALQAIAVPKIDTSIKSIEPPLVALRLGNEIFIKGIVNGAISVTYEKPILYNNRYAQVKLSFEVTEVDPYDANYVYKNGSFRGMVSTLNKNWNMQSLK